MEQQNNFIGNLYLQNCGDKLLVLRQYPEKVKGKTVFECEFQKYPYKILALKGNILQGKVVNPQIEKTEFIDKIWPQNCGDSLRVIEKVYREKYRRYQFKCQFLKYSCEVITDKINIIKGNVENPEIEKYEFIGKTFLQRCKDSLIVLEKTNQQVKEKSNFLYRCKFINYPYEVLATKGHIIEGCVSNPQIEIEEFAKKEWLQNCGDILKVLKKTDEKRGGEKEFYWLCEFIKYPCQVKVLKETVKHGQVDNPNLPWKSKDSIVKWIQEKFPNQKPTLTELGDSFGIARVTIGQKINEFGLKDYINYSYLGKENYLREYINSLGIECYSKTFSKELNCKEIDCYIPSSKIGFEFNGNYWHSELYLKQNYHQNKQLEFKEKENIELFNIFEYEWQEKEEILKEYIKSKLGIFNKKIGARKCKVKKITTKEYQNFCNINHLQGEAGAKIKLGLYLGDELVQIMSFGVPRFSDFYQYEIIRECSKLGYATIGGKEKLWNYFVQNWNPTSVVSYCDFSKFRGDSYLKLGFKQERLNTPGFVWYDDTTKQVFWRDPFNHKKMKEKYLKIWDCGQLVFVWKNK